MTAGVEAFFEVETTAALSDFLAVLLDGFEGEAEVLIGPVLEVILLLVELDTDWRLLVEASEAVEALATFEVAEVVVVDGG